MGATKEGLVQSGHQVASNALGGAAVPCSQTGFLEECMWLWSSPYHMAAAAIMSQAANKYIIIFVRTCMDRKTAVMLKHAVAVWRAT